MNLEQILTSFGYIGLFIIIFAESGLLAGFFLPGDTLLFSAGFFSSPAKPAFNIFVTLITIFVAASLGDNVGYFLGKKYGRNLFEKKESRFFRKDLLKKAEDFYSKYGPITIVVARFVPVVRTFVPTVAGIVSMDRKVFLTYNLIGGAIWTLGVTLTGYAVGNGLIKAIFGVDITPETVDKFLLPILAVVVTASIVPSLLHLFKKH